MHKHWVYFINYKHIPNRFSHVVHHLCLFCLKKNTSDADLNFLQRYLDYAAYIIVTPLY